MSEIKYSLVIGTRNPNKEWFEAALNSAEGLFDEVIIVDDCSDTPVPNATVRHEVNRKFFEARNTGIALARGEWIISLDDDDEFIRENVEQLKSVIDFYDADIVHFPCVLFGEQTGVWGHTPRLHEILQANQLPSGSWFKKTVWEKLKGFQLEEGDDWDFWARATKHGMKFVYFSLPIYKHRMRSGSMSANWLGDKYLQLRNNVQKNYEKERIEDIH